MDTDGSRPPSELPPSARWSIYAGLYMLLCATAVAFVLSDVLILLGDALGLPTEYAMFILASPALVIGAVVWWALVERRDSYAYRTGGVFGLLTALLTGLLWVVRFASGWGLEMLLVIGVLVGVVLVVAVTVGALAGPALMYVRRRADDGPSSDGDRGRRS